MVYTQVNGRLVNRPPSIIVVNQNYISLEMKRTLINRCYYDLSEQLHGKDHSLASILMLNKPLIYSALLYSAYGYYEYSDKNSTKYFCSSANLQ